MTPAREPGKATNCRTLRFDSLDDCIEEVERIVSADERAALVAAGNWTPGQIMAHIAAWIEYGYEGFPIGPPPFFVRWFLRLRLRKMLRDGMPRGVRIPGVPQGTVGIDEMATRDAGTRLIRALRRLQDGEEAKYDSPAFGAMSHEDRIALNLRHAELHLGFLDYAAESHHADTA
jgi:hypothetical protein